MIGFLQTAAYWIIPFLLIIGVVVTVHELGHFLAARWLGTAVDRFSIGFGKAIAHWTDRHGVEWRIGWLPLGGYVRFAGDENAASLPDQAELDTLKSEIVAKEGAGALSRYFHFKPLWQRAIIVAAGPFANFVLATVIFAGLLMTVGEPRADVVVRAVEAGSPAQAAGFRPGDRILEAQGRTVRHYSDVQQVIALRTGSVTEFLVERSGSEVTLVGTPERGDVRDVMGGTQRLGRVGLAFEDHPTVMERRGPLSAIVGGVQRCQDVISTTVFYLGRMISGREKADQISGPLGMAHIAGGLTKQNVQHAPDFQSLVAGSLLTLVSLMAHISVGIGFLNLLPVPVLDGGHLLFYAYEAVARRPLAAKVQAAGYRVGLALVLGLMLFATWNDLQRLRVFNFFGGLFS
ncbi:RIP metalloprotease [Phenylobacterium sp.]|jgi:regulator of sigma E protease|uniref:M50 family metallopeptidase n=1 Tax=Phenylobacterium sp. TaxID=1871053 RepID=UPI002F92EEB7